MDCWNSGILGIKTGNDGFFVFLLLTPSFQYSIIPISQLGCCSWGKTNEFLYDQITKIFRIIDSTWLFEGLLPSFDLNVEIILIRGDDADVPLVIDTGGIVRHIEIDDRFISRHDDLCIEIAASLVRPISVGLIPKGDKEMVAARRLIQLRYIFLTVELKSNPSITDVSLLYPFIG